jgi:hypothetical protein
MMTVAGAGEVARRGMPGGEEDESYTLPALPPASLLPMEALRDGCGGEPSQAAAVAALVGGEA